MAKQAIKKVEIGLSDDSIVDLKSKERKQGNFKIHRIEDEEDSQPVSSANFFNPQLNERMENFAEKLEKAVIKVSPATENKEHKSEPKELVKVKFGNFVKLVATRDFEKILEENENEDLIMSSNLLTDLASAMDEKKEKRLPVIFLVGLALGVLLTYILINK